MVNCFPCFTCQKSNKENQSKREHGTTTHDQNVTAKPPDMKKQRPEETAQVDASDISAKHYTFRELATATKNFRQECLLGEGGFGRVYRGIIPATGQTVAVKQLDRNGMNGVKEFLAEVHTLSLLHHENLVNLIGYCADGDQRLLVHEFVQGATLEDHLLASKEDQAPLDWFTRMKVAAGAARGLEYLHDNANPPVIFRDLKPSDILLDCNHNAKLFDFGLSHGGDKNNLAPPRVMGTYGYCAPEYARTGQLTLKSDVYSFGVVLLELITGRRAVDTTKPNEEQNLVSWAQPLFRDPKRYPDMADPNLNKDFPEKDLNQAVAIAAMCLQEEAEARPLMSDVVTALSFLSVVPPAAPAPAAAADATPPVPAAASLPRVASKASVASGSELSDSESDRGRESESEAGSEYEYYSKNGSRRGSNSMRSSYSGSESGSFSSYSTKGSSKQHHNGVPAAAGAEKKAASRKASTRDRELSQKSKSSKKTNSVTEKKSSRKSTIRGMGEKISSMTNSVRVMTHKSSAASVSEDGAALSRNSSRASRGNISFGLTSSGSVQTGQNSRSSSRSASMRSMGSDVGSIGSSGSEVTSVKSR